MIWKIVLYGSRFWIIEFLCVQPYVQIFTFSLKKRALYSSAQVHHFLKDRENKIMLPTTFIFILSYHQTYKILCIIYWKNVWLYTKKKLAFKKTKKNGFQGNIITRIFERTYIIKAKPTHIKNNIIYIGDHHKLFIRYKNVPVHVLFFVMK